LFFLSTWFGSPHSLSWSFEVSSLSATSFRAILHLRKSSSSMIEVTAMPLSSWDTSSRCLMACSYRTRSVFVKVTFAADFFFSPFLSTGDLEMDEVRSIELASDRVLLRDDCVLLRSDVFVRLSEATSSSNSAPHFMRRTSDQRSSGSSPSRPFISSSAARTRSCNCNHWSSIDLFSRSSAFSTFCTRFISLPMLRARFSRIPRTTFASFFVLNCM
ncbi:hypothetical protein PMAYCL1PPCAC_09812, partial [Pristionchus mayeri]